MKKTLVAGIGNLLLGDDGFGPEIIRTLEKEKLPDNIELRDMGIAGVTTATEIDDYELVIFVDAMEIGEKPGSLKLMKIEVENISPEEVLDLSRFSVHELSLETILKISKAMDTLPEEVYILGCQPERLEVGCILSPEVRDVIPAAVEKILNLIKNKD